MKLYLDTCCWGRPYDDHIDDKAYREAAAILHITKSAKWYGHTIYGSLTLDEEIEANSDADKRADALGLYNKTVTARADYVESVFSYVEPMAIQAGIRQRDAFHLCYAIAAGADYLLTTDVKFLKKAARLNLPITVINPLQFNAGSAI